MDFGEKIVAKFRVGFREAKNETRREKRAKSVFRAFEKSNFLIEKVQNLRQKFFLLSAKITLFLG